MKAKNQNKLISAVLMTVLGILFIVFKNEVISIALTVLGVLLVVQAILDFIHKAYVSGVIRAVIGALILVFGIGNLLVTVALYVMAAVLLVYGILQLIGALKALNKNSSLLAKIFAFLEPAVCLFIAVCLLFNQGGTIAWVFIVAGIFLIIDGVIALIDCLANK